jgi:hypothetical protein
MASAAHPQRPKQPRSQEVLPGRAGEHVHDVPGEHVAEVAVLEGLAQVPAERQEPQPPDHVSTSQVRMTDPGQVVPGQSGPVRQQVDDGQPLGHHGVMQPKAREVVAERALPLEQAVIHQGANRGRREGLGDGPDGEQRLRGDRQVRVHVAAAPPRGQHDAPVLDGGDSAPRDLPGSELLDDEPVDVVHAVPFEDRPPIGRYQLPPAFLGVLGFAVGSNFR